MDIYRPKIQIKPTENGGFKIVDKDNDVNQLATIMEFIPTNSDLPIKSVKEFIEYLKIAFKRIIGILIPIILVLIYLIVTNSLQDFINYAGKSKSPAF